MKLTTGKKMFQLINDAWNVLQDDTKRQEYTVLWKEYQKQKLMPFERAELARKEGNEYYKKGTTSTTTNYLHLSPLVRPLLSLSA